MVYIKNIIIRYRHKKQNKTIEVKRPVPVQSSTELKKITAEILEEIQFRAEYYYCIIEIELPNGKSAFRTVIPRTML